MGNIGANNGQFPGGQLTVGRYGKLYGLTGGGSPAGCKRAGIFSFDPKTFALQVVRCLPHTLYNPSGLTPNPAGTPIFGVTEGGGTPEVGTIFAVSPFNDRLNVVYSFSGGSDGEIPEVRPTFDEQGDLFGVSYEFADGLSGPVVYELPAGTKR